MAESENNTRICKRCGYRGTAFRPQKRTCRSCERIKRREWGRREDGYALSEDEYFAKQTRKWFVESNPHLKWCEKGQHFVDRRNFTRLSKSSDGLQPKCKDCRREYRTVNAAQINAKKKVYREVNRGRINAGLRDWYHNRCDKKKHAEDNKRWREQNADYQKQWNREYYLNNAERLINNVRRRYQTHKHLWSIYAENRIARKKGASGSFTAEQWQAKLIYFGYRCYLCHISLHDQEIHVEHRIPLSRGGSNWIANIAPSCRKCNLRKSTKTETEFRHHLKIAPR